MVVSVLSTTLSDITLQTCGIESRLSKVARRCRHSPAHFPSRARNSIAPIPTSPPSTPLPATAKKIHFYFRMPTVLPLLVTTIPIPHRILQRHLRYRTSMNRIPTCRPTTRLLFQWTSHLGIHPATEGRFTKTSQSTIEESSSCRLDQCNPHANVMFLTVCDNYLCLLCFSIVLIIA